MLAERVFDVRGHGAFVTGAASGLGLAMAEVMAANGAGVTLADVDATGLAAAVDRLRAAGHAVEGRVLDVRDSVELRAAVDGCAARWGRLDAAFANADISAGPGFATGQTRLEDTDMAAWDDVLKINLTSVFVTVQAAAAHMRPRNTGRIVVTASIAGLRAEPLVGYAYVATKAAIANVVRQAARELAPHGISVNAIAPGPFMTNIAGGRLWREPEMVKRFADTIPMGRLAGTDEIKGLALLLGSPAASYITGAVIPIDGGTTA